MAIAIRVWEHGDSVSCKLTIPFVPKIGGSMSVVATLTTRQVLDAMKRGGITFSKKQAEHIGSLFGGIGKFLKKVAKSSVMKTALSLGKAIINSPIVKLVAPQAAAAIQAASMAAKLVSAARGGDKKKAAKAKLAIVAAQAQAKKEDQAGKQLPLPTGVANRGPETKGAFRYLVTVNRAAA